MTETTDPNLMALAERAQNAGSDGAPVDLWDPPFCGEMDMRIASDGRWFHEGTPITREPLVRLFASVLKQEEDGETYLVTPVEKLRITVDDAHFIAVEVARSMEDGAQVLTFRTNTGDLVTADEAHPIRLPMTFDAEFAPYITVRGRLTAKASRPVALELAEWLQEDEAGPFLMSRGVRFDGPKDGANDG